MQRAGKVNFGQIFSLTDFRPMFPFSTPYKHHKPWYPDISKGQRKRGLTWIGSQTLNRNFIAKTYLALWGRRDDKTIADIFLSIIEAMKSFLFNHTVNILSITSSKLPIWLVNPCMCTKFWNPIGWYNKIYPTINKYCIINGA